jgi:hypothetical protein
MEWLSIALVVITTEIIAYKYVVQKQRKLEQTNPSELNDRIKIIEDQISSIRIAQGIRRRDGQSS